MPTDMKDTRIFRRLGVFESDGYGGYADTRIFWCPEIFGGSDMTDTRIHGYSGVLKNLADRIHGYDGYADMRMNG